MSKLTQSRDGIKQLILENPSVATWTTTGTITDEMTGKVIPDPSGITTTHKERVRLSHERSGVSSDEVTPAGLGTSYTLFVLAEYTTELEKGVTFYADGKSYTVGAVDALRKYNGVIGYQAPLTEVS